MEYIQYEEQSYIGTLTIQRPKALNALNTQLVNELLLTLDQCKATDIRALIITGAGEKAFVAGADIGEMRELTPEQAASFCEHGNEVMTKIESFPVPVIAAINGYALGGGCELALSCDIRIAAENAVFGFPEVTLGILPGYGGLQRLSRTVGIGNARILAFTADRIKADQALELGLVDRVCAKDVLMQEARSIAVKIANNAPVAIRASKKIMNSSIGLTLQDAACLERQGFAECFGTEDQLNAMGAFLKINQPVPFIGR